MEKIHISFTGGCRGEYLSAVVYTAMFNKLPNFEITKTGKMRIRHEPLITKTHKLVTINDPLDNFDKVTEQQYMDIVKSNNEPIGISHYVPALSRYEDLDFDTNCFLVNLLKSHPIIVIQHDKKDSYQIAYQSFKKNQDKKLEDIIDAKGLKWLEICKKYFKNFAYIDYKDLVDNVPTVLSVISKHTGVPLNYNRYTEKIVQEYRKKNKQYEFNI